MRWVFLRCLPLIGLIWGVIGPVHTQGADFSSVEQLLDAVQERSAGISSFSSRFVQTRYLSIFPQPVKFSGQLTMARPDRLRWEFLEPVPSVLLLDGRQGMKCDGDAPPRVFNLDADPVMRMVARQLLAWTSGTYRDVRENFDFDLIPGPGLGFTPKAGGAENVISRIEVIFEPETLQPLSVSINEPGGDHTLIVFAEYREITPSATLFNTCSTGP
ncbi:MAG: outer membrane lipoprotein carrier protein LolA [Proteobacteria bacterium]|nr:outer membrane lipoprotein carrier protein LolA [Pseudomonadota bacterium]MBU1685861.1 outer membrane lipoprotein carrier protein LolA [Pseudomonadota bacterium]